MHQFNGIKDKLEQFIRRYYSNQLLKGAILFFAIGLLYFLFTLFVEYILWLGPFWRTILFWLFVTVELVLFVRFIFGPLLKLLRLRKGISYEEASKIIGSHFPEVNDKLLNVLQLQKRNEQSELLLASIEQKSAELSPVPFKLAVNFKSNFKYLKYAVLPVSIVLLSFLFGQTDWFSQSYTRVVNYNMAFQPPAPFEFFVVNELLVATENSDFKLEVHTVGKVVPDNVQIYYDGQTHFMGQSQPGRFEYTFPQLKNAVSFQLLANQVRSKTYQLEVATIPALVNFEMQLNFPEYLRKKDEVLKTTGNTTVPEGTLVTWRITTRSTDRVRMYAGDTIVLIEDHQNEFYTSRRLTEQFDYQVTTSNSNFEDYERLQYSIAVIKDAYPELRVEMARDSIDAQVLYFFGQASDDYGLSKLQLVYFPAGQDTDKNFIEVPVSHTNFEEFVFAFPNFLELEPGVAYELYFEAFDNDVRNGFKRVRSQSFTYHELSALDVEQLQLEQQGETLKNMDKGLEELRLQEKDLNELNSLQKENPNLSFTERKRLENFLKRQKQQDEMMQHFNRSLRDNFDQPRLFEPDSDPFKDDLKQRLKDNDAVLKRNEQLLKELEALHDKIQQEELTERLEQLAKQNKNSQKSLQQILELTKRYYVAKKAEKLQRELLKLAYDQEQLSDDEGPSNTKSEQEDLNAKFDAFSKALDALEKENRDLKKPLDLPRDKFDEEDIRKEQQEALDQLEKIVPSDSTGKTSDTEQDVNKAKQYQKNAAKKMKQLSLKMAQSMLSGGGQQLQEDATALRQILKNLLVFSFDQEHLMEAFNSIQVNHNQYGVLLRRQSNLREHFSHIDDSLFALSMRQPRLSESINQKITDVFFYMDKAMEDLSENLLYQGAASQHYAMTGANDLASVLSDILDQMESDLNPSSGSGSGSDRQEQQLPDIIMSQEALNKAMQEGLESRQSGASNKGQGNEKGEDGVGESPGVPEESGKTSGDSETMNGMLYEIYQQQQALRRALEERLRQGGLSPEGQNVLKEMERVESDLINTGFTNSTLTRMMAIRHQLLKLDQATYLQDEEQRRQGTTNKRQFDNSVQDLTPRAKEYFNTTEILNRQALPLQNIYRKKVQGYFKRNDD